MAQVVAAAAALRARDTWQHTSSLDKELRMPAVRAELERRDAADVASALVASAHRAGIETRSSVGHRTAVVGLRPSRGRRQQSDAAKIIENISRLSERDRAPSFRERTPRTGRGTAAAARGSSVDGSQHRRGRPVDRLWTGRGAAAAAAWIVRRLIAAPSRPPRGSSVD